MMNALTDEFCLPEIQLGISPGMGQNKKARAQWYYLENKFLKINWIQDASQE